jgi:hypothetical protein
VAYKFTTGSVDRGDIYNEEDAQGNTYLDWSEDAFGIVAGAELAFTVSGSNNEISSSYNLSASSFYGDGSGLSNITADPAGSNTYVQYNNAGSTGADSGFVYDGDGIVGLTASSNAWAGLGIGISSPGAPLHIYEDTSPTVRIQKATGTDIYTDYVQGGNGMYMYGRYGDYDGIYKWYGRGGNVTNHYATLNSHGLGIKRDPAANTNLHVSGSDSDTMIHVDATTNNDIFVVLGDGNVGIGTSSPTSTFEVSGSQAVNYAQTAASITFTETHFIVDYTGNGDATFTLPTPSGVTGRMYYVVSHAQGASDALTVTSSGDATAFQGPNLEGDQVNVDIQGNTPQSLHIISTGVNWFILHDGRTQG